MGVRGIFFFDTYAFCEILKENLNYKAYQNKIAVVTTNLNLMELHYGLLITLGKEEADRWYDEYSPYAVAIDDLIIKKATEFRSLHRKRNLSYIDCIGYIIAKTRGIPFLTGDQQFKDLENVEFVK